MTSKKLLVTWPEVEWTATRSTGAGGQHVNKTNSAVQLRFDVMKSLYLSAEEKQKILKRCSHRIVNESEILIRSEDERDQRANKETAFKRLVQILEKALVDPKPRKKTKPTYSSVQKRVETKRHRSDIKKGRSKKNLLD